MVTYIYSYIYTRIHIFNKRNLCNCWRCFDRHWRYQNCRSFLRASIHETENFPKEQVFKKRICTGRNRPKDLAEVRRIKTASPPPRPQRHTRSLCWPVVGPRGTHRHSGRNPAGGVSVPHTRKSLFPTQARIPPPPLSQRNYWI